MDAVGLVGATWSDGVEERDFLDAVFGGPFFDGDMEVFDFAF